MGYTIDFYETKNKKSPFNDWLDDLDATVQFRILARLKNVSLGNLGNHEPVGDGIYELKIDSGPGYRIYYTLIDKKLIFILAAGTKRRQSQDIEKSKEYLHEFKMRGMKNAKNKKL